MNSTKFRGERKVSKRKLCVVALVFGCLIVSCTSPAPPVASVNPSSVPVADLVAQADKLYSERDDLERLRAGINALRRARAAGASNYEVVWRLAKFNYYLGDRAKDDPTRKDAFRDGIEAGESAVRIAPNRPEGHFWLGANLGGQAKFQGALSSLATVPEIRREMEAVLKIDEKYLGGSAYIALGEIDLQLPELLGGDPQRAVELLEKGLGVDDSNTLTRLRLAEAYLAVKRPADARRQLDAILKTPPDPDYLPEHKESTAAARELLDKRF